MQIFPWLISIIYWNMGPIIIIISNSLRGYLPWKGLRACLAIKNSLTYTCHAQIIPVETHHHLTKRFTIMICPSLIPCFVNLSMYLHDELISIITRSKQAKMADVFKAGGLEPGHKDSITSGKNWWHSNSCKLYVEDITYNHPTKFYGNRLWFRARFGGGESCGRNVYLRLYWHHDRPNTGAWSSIKMLHVLGGTRVVPTK